MFVLIKCMCSISPVRMLVRYAIPFEGEREHRQRISFRVKEHFDPQILVDRVVRRLAEEMRNRYHEHDNYDCGGELCVVFITFVQPHF